MRKQLLHTPEGVRDIYNEECEKKLILQDRLYMVMKEYGYHPIQTPTFEFFDIFGKEIGTTPSKELYKFFDREGNTLVLRPDITPSIARAVAKYFMDEEMPIRLCYMGNTFINNSSYQGRLKESTQLGAELIGDGSVDADAEIIAMVVDALKTAGLKEFQLSIGHAEYFAGLIEAANISEEAEEEVKNLISNKNFFGVEEFIENLHLNSELKALFSLLGSIDSSLEQLEQAKELAKTYPRILTALENLEELMDLLEAYDVMKYVSVDLGIVSSYQYYTGIIFAGYTFGSGEAIVKGGRYDKLLPYYGKQAASIGFAVVIDQLMAALSRQKIDISVEKNVELLVYAPTHRKEAIKRAMELRAKGVEVELMSKSVASSLDKIETYMERNCITNVVYMED